MTQLYNSAAFFAADFRRGSWSTACSSRINQALWAV